MFHHVSVMLNETIDYLNIKEDGVLTVRWVEQDMPSIYLIN